MNHSVEPQEVVGDQVGNPADGRRQPRTLANLKFEIARLRMDSSSETVYPKCPRVPKSLSSDARGSELSDDHHYEPVVMSLGPYHHGNPKLVRGENIKLQLAVDFFGVFEQFLLHRESDQPVDQTVDQPVHRPFDQPVDQLVDQPVDQPLDQPIDQSVDQLLDQPVDQLVDQSVDQPVDQPVHQPVYQPLYQPVDQPLDQPEDQPVGQPLDQPVDQPVDQPLDQALDWPVDQPVNQPLDQSVDQPVDQLVDQPLGQPVDQLDQKTEKVVDKLYSKIRGIVNVLWAYYDKELMENYSDEEFCVMMLVDGCALVRFMVYACIDYDDSQEDFDISYEDLTRLHRDALLLENQLPFKLLLMLMKMCKIWDISCWRMICSEFCGITESKAEAYSFLQKMKKFCCGWFPAIREIINRQRRPNPDEESSRSPDEESGSNPDEESRPCHLLDLYLVNFLGSNRSSPTHGEDNTGGVVSIADVKEQIMASSRNVKELMAAGIRIKHSPTGHLRDISFRSNGITACLRIPPITIDYSTKAMFLNLIAYEMSSDVDHDFISYLRFLDSLIDTADDVNELQSIGILQNNLGTHEEVAEFFNTVSAKLESNIRAYKDVRVKIRNHLRSHHDSKVKRWLTQCLDTYFCSPWTIIAWVGAALVLFFTAVQTYFSAFSH